MKNTDFDFKRIAQGYKDRPYLHKNVIDAFQKFNGNRHFESGLDIGCGAGLSTKALADICDKAVGIDISAQMIEVANEVCREFDNIQFKVSSAEDCVCEDSGFDIVTAAGAIQWIERDTFLNNMKRMMKLNGYLFIYDFAISDEMVGNKDYSQWWSQQYLKEFPRPFRNEKVWKLEDVIPYGFNIIKQEASRMEYLFDLESFISFMMIQSNVNAQIDGNGRDVEAVKEWFRKTLSPVFKGERKILIFKGYNWYIQKVK